MPSDVHHAAWPLGGRRAAVVAHMVVRMSDTRKMLLRLLSKRGNYREWYHRIPPLKTGIGTNLLGFLVLVKSPYHIW